MQRKVDLIECLKYIDPSSCTYEEWTEIGMALKHEGYSSADWDSWSRNDHRYKSGECAKKWNSFKGASDPVTGGTIYQMAVNNGYQPERGFELDWDSPIDLDGIVVDKAWLEGRDVHEPKKWSPANQLIEYLETLFEPGECVGFVTASWQNESGKYIPKNSGVNNKTAGQLIEELSKCEDDIGRVVGDYQEGGGAWIRFNPLDGNGARNENVTEYRYALVESDDMPVAEQNAILRELELPIAVLVHSGGKSLHAIVKIDAADEREYKKRVNYLYEICKKNGMIIDEQNKNPSRLSRMPGCVRGDKKQFIVDKNLGKTSWDEWHEWIEAVNDNLPEVESLEDYWDDLPALAPALIDGVLREGHKMLIAGPSKAGKSFSLIELVIAIAEGRKWLTWQCSKGKVLYVNLELDSASCLHRFKDVYKALGWPANSRNNIDIWNLRGKSAPMDKLAPKLIRRAAKKNYKAIIIDPIYKVITGDENSADQMAKFCNQFDMVCTELGCAVIYCHHHSKGSQGQKKAIDRSSGSGVFARDPDAVLDLIELEIDKEMLKQQINKCTCRAVKAYMDAHMLWKEDPAPDVLLNSQQLVAFCENQINEFQQKMLLSIVHDAEQEAEKMTAWRIEGTLREFAGFAPVDCWFNYPIHYIDASGALKDTAPESERLNPKELTKRRKENATKKRSDYKIGFDLTFESAAENGEVTVQDLAEQLGIDSKTICAWFGSGKKSRKEYKADYEIFMGLDGKRYLRKHTVSGVRPTEDKM